MKIVDTDAFLDMPQSSQLLYFHLSMRADDDGFVSSPKKIMKIIGSGDDDLKVLFTKRFVLPFDSGVCVIKHWKIHNYIQNDRYIPTQYVKEKAMIKVDPETQKYQLKQGEKDGGVGNVSKVDTQVRLEVGKDRVRRGKKEASQSDALKGLIELFKEINPSYERIFSNKTERAALQRLLDKMGMEKLTSTIDFAKKTNGMAYAPTITTPYELEKKLGALIAFYNKENNKGQKNKVEIAI